jgi:hypothetical protein
LINILIVCFVDVEADPSFFYGKFDSFCENFRGPMEMVEMDHYFQCSAKKIGFCVRLKIFNSARWDCWIWWSEFVFLLIYL